nr:hypothetical protein B0A51_05959 [Rachicladosporium sp. CCFEE 5018]
MPRYTVTVVDAGQVFQATTLLIPLAEGAIVSALHGQIFVRCIRQQLQITLDSHSITLHLGDASGPVIDQEDVLSDVVLQPQTERVFAVCSAISAGSGVASDATATQSAAALAVFGAHDGAILRVRLRTPANVKDAVSSLPTFNIQHTSNIKQLHDQAAQTLGLPQAFEEPSLVDECNCNFARRLADAPSSECTLFVIYDKSVVKPLRVLSTARFAIDEALQTQFGVDLESKKKIHYHGVLNASGVFLKMPVMSICSKERHIPAHARATALMDESTQARLRLLDLHTSELPIHASSMGVSITASGITGLAEDGALEIFAIYGDRAHWQPPIRQSNRGMAMFLSSLRVTASLVKEMSRKESDIDAVLHVFDVLIGFSPALRTFYLLTQGKTPTAQECAALSHAIFYALEEMVPSELVGAGKDRLFEGSRLLFGLLLEKAKSIRLPSIDAQPFHAPYLTCLSGTQLLDVQTQEPIMHAVNTDIGPVEQGYHDAFAKGGPLYLSPAQPRLVLSSHHDLEGARSALLSGGSTREIVAFSKGRLQADYRYEDGGNQDSVFDPTELTDLHYLAELCGQNKLAVHMPSQLVSAEHPCLTFDRNAHLAVYLGEEACGTPGKSSLVFRPQHGTSAEDTAVIEQLIAPIVKAYENAGTSVFDASGGAAVRKAEAPDEILMFCVDVSASMRTSTDFSDINDDDEIADPTSGEPVIEGEWYTCATFDDLKEILAKHESFDDMMGMICATHAANKRACAMEVLNSLKKQLSDQLVQKLAALEQARRRNAGFFRPNATDDQTAALNKLKTFRAGLQTHELGLCDFLQYRAATMPRTRTWTWSVGDAVPSSAPAQHIPALPATLTEIPDDLCCPVSHALMDDAVKATDGHTYSRTALQQWYAVRHSSPLHGTPTTDISMQNDIMIASAAAAWMLGDGLIGLPAESSAPSPAKKRRSDAGATLTINFDSRVGGFQRVVPISISSNNLHRLAYRGLKGRHNIFQLALKDSNRVVFPDNRALTHLVNGIMDTADISIRIAEESDMTRGVADRNAQAGQLALVKIFTGNNIMDCSYWVDRYTTVTAASVLWKLWRFQAENYGYITSGYTQIWTQMTDSGDGLASGHPCKKSGVRLSTFLNRGSCYGHLGAESVFNDHSRTIDYSAPLVLKVSVAYASPNSAKRSMKLSRLDVLKQMFEALINRILGFRFKTHLGLVTISTKATLQTPISHVVENFRRATSTMSANGDTALWDALALARDQLSQYALQHTQAKKRIIVISDGYDTKSVKNTGHDVAFECKANDIAVDTVILGDTDNKELAALSGILGGYSFKPTSLINALAMCEMEPFLSITERPTIVLSANLSRERYAFGSQFRRRMWNTTYTEVSDTRFPERKAHPNVNDSFIPLSAATQLPGRPAAGAAGARSNMRINRLLNEMRQLVSNGSSTTYDVYVSESDISFWKVVMSGPDDTPYAGGNFLLYVDFEERYPAFAPKARFITRIKHVNVNLHGRICHSILDRDWTSDTSMSRLLDTFYGLLFQAELSDPINTSTTLGYHHDQVEYADEVRVHVRKYARQSREAWKDEILDGVEWEGDSEGNGSEDEDRTRPGYSENDEDDEDDDEMED